MFRKRLIVASSSALLAISLQASAKGNAYMLAFHIIQQGKTEVSPTIVVKERTPGTIQVSGKEGYFLSATASDAGQGKIKIFITYNSPSNSSSSVVIVKEGKEASLKRGDMEIKLIATRRDS